MSTQELRVLIVEGPAHNRVKIERLLSKGDSYSVDTARDAKEAWQLVKESKRPYEVVFVENSSRSNGEQSDSACIDLKTRIQGHSPETKVVIYSDSELNSDGSTAATLLGNGNPSSIGETIAGFVRLAEQHERSTSVARQEVTLGQVLETADVLVSGHSEDEVIDYILRGVQAAGFDRVRLYLFSDDGQYLVGRAHVGMDESFLGVQWPVADDVYLQTLMAAPRPYVFKRERDKLDVEERLGKDKIEEWACVPIVLRGTVVGNVSADNKHSHRPIIEEELVSVALFTSLAAAAIENARILRDAQNRAKHLEALRRTALAVGAQLDRHTLLETILREAVSLLGASSGGVYEYHRDRGELTLIADYRQPDRLGVSVMVGEGMAGRLALNGLPYMIVDDYDSWEGRAGVYEANRELGAVLQVSLKFEGEVIGVLSVDDKLPRRFTEDDARLLNLFSDHAAIALSNADLAEEKARRLEILSRISSSIVSDLGSLTLEERFDLIARRAAEILQAEACSIHLMNREGLLNLHASYGNPESGLIRGQELTLVSSATGGLTGHIAKQGRMFNAWGSALANHFAVSSEDTEHLPSKRCYSLLALPLKNSQDQLVGLLRLENKLGSDGKPDHGLHFTADDELILNSFGQAVVVAIEASALVEQLGERKDHLDRLIDSSPNGIISIDVEGKVTSFNERAEEITGYSAPEVLGHSVSGLYYPADEPRRIGMLLHSSHANKLRGYSTQLMSKEGEQIPVRLSATWLYGAQGTRVGSVAYFEDLRSIRDAERRHELLLRASTSLAHAENLTDGLNGLAQLMVSFLRHTFCRIQLVDDNESFLVTEAVYPAPSNSELDWEPTLGSRISISDWAGLPQILNKGRPIVLDLKDSRVRANLERLSHELTLREPIKSLLLVPLTIENRVVGLLELGELRSEALSKFTEEEIELAAAIASQTTLLIDRMRLLEQARKSGEKLRELFEASNALVSDRDIQGTLRDIVERTRSAAESGLVRVIIFDPAGEARIQAVAGTQFREFGLSDALRPDGISMQVMQKREAEWIGDVSEKEPGYVNSEYLEAGIEAAICFPLLLGGKPIGVMWISYDRPKYFSLELKQNLQLYVNQAAIACGNAWRLDQMMRLHSAAEQMSRATELTEVLITIVDQAKDFFHADSSTLWSYDSALGAFIPDQFAGSGIPDAVVNELRVLEPEQAGLTQALWERRYLAVSDIESETRSFLRPDVADLLRQAEIASFQGIALEDGYERLGVLYLSYRRPRQFSEEDERQLNDFAAYAAVSIRKARLLDQIDKTRKAAGVVARAAKEGRIATALSSLAAVIQQGLGADALTLYSASHADGRLKHLPGVAGLTRPEETLRYESVTTESTVWKMLEKDEPYIAESVKEDAILTHSKFARREDVQSCCAVPLKARGRTVGAMFVNYRKRHRFTADELNNIEMFANQAGVAIANTQLFEELGGKINEQEELLRLSERLMRCTSVQEILESAVTVAASVLGTDFSNIILPDKEGNLILSAAVGLPPEQVGKYQLAPGKGSQTGYTIAIKMPVISHDYSSETRFTPPIAIESDVKSGLSVPMFLGGEVVGAILVQSKTQRSFSGTDADFLSLVANQTAIAVQRVEHFEAANRKSAEIKALYEASQAIASASRGLKRRQILDRIVEQAVKSVARTEGGRAMLGTLQLYDAGASELVFESVYPPEKFPGLVDRLGERRATYRRDHPGWRIGVTGRTVIERRPQLVSDVTKDSDYLEFEPSTKSQLMVPLFDPLSDSPRDDYPLIGVLNIESDQSAAFDPDDVRTLQALGEMAVIAIKNAEQYEVLRRTQGLIGARTALAWMGMTSNHWRHTVQGHAITIKDLVFGIQRELSKTIDAAARTKIERRLKEIGELAGMVEQHPITAPLSSEEGVVPVLVNVLLRERIHQLLGDATYKHVTPRFNLVEQEITVRVSPDWLRKALDLLFENAVEAMTESVHRVLTIGTNLTVDAVEISIGDTGRGVPDEVAPRLFKERIEKPKDARGLGIGLLMAQCIVQAYGGEIRLDSTSPHGTTMVISLPREA